MTDFGNRIKELRESQGKTQEYIGKIIGKSGKAVSKYESGERQPKLDDVVCIARDLSVTSDYLLGISDVSVSTENISKNIRYIMGDMSVCDFVKNLEDKTGKTIGEGQMNSYLSGVAIPPDDILGVLSRYAELEPVFFTKYNEDLWKKKHQCAEMEELYSMEHCPVFKRVLCIAVNIIKRDLDIDAIEKIIEGMAQLKQSVQTNNEVQKRL